MGSWFTSEYDLYAEVVRAPGAAGAGLARAFALCGREDLEQDVMDAGDSISAAGSFEEALDPVSFLRNRISEIMGIPEKVEKTK